jgi:hypothetical protein
MKTALEKVINLADELEHFVEASVDSRYWGGPTIHPDNPITENTAKMYAAAIRELIAERSATFEPPAGWKLVPTPITREMMEAGYRAYGDTLYVHIGERQLGWGQHAENIFSRMVNAAEKPK